MSDDPRNPNPPTARMLPVRFVVYLPGSALDDIRQSVETKLCERFGGVTSYAAEGVFKRAEGGVQREKVRVVECYAEQGDWQASEKMLLLWLAELCVRLEQESIACSIDGKMVLTRRPAG